MTRPFLTRPFYLFVGLRYLRAEHSSFWGSFITLFALAGSTVSVAALITVMAVMNGFEGEIRGRLLNAVPHLTIATAEKSFADWSGIADSIGSRADVLSVEPYIEGKVMALSNQGGRGLNITALSPTPDGHHALDQFMLSGSVADLAHDSFTIILGSILAQQLGVYPGQSVRIMLPQVSITPLGVFPRSRLFKVIGVFELGAQLDATKAYVSLETGRRLFGVGASDVAGLRVFTNDIYHLGPLINSLPPSYRVVTWQEAQATLFNAIKMEKTMMRLLLAIVVAVAAFNIISVMTMLVNDKRRDIAVLRSMGASQQQIYQIFIASGVVLAFIGCGLGAALGCALALYIGDIVHWFELVFNQRLFDPDVYYIAQLPSDLQWFDVASTAGLGFVLTLAAVYYPAKRASLVSPALALQYES